MLNCDLIRNVVAFIFLGTMQSMGQKDLLDLPNEVIQDNLMAFLSNQALYKLIGIGNRRLTYCCYRVINKRPYSKYHLAIVFLIKLVCYQ